MEVFITRSNAERIIKKMDVKALDITEFAEQMQFKWFNNWELGTLMAYELFFSNPQQFVAQLSELKPRETQRSFVYKNTIPPAFHYFDNCQRMLSNYENIRIPESIVSSKREEEFIEWCAANEDLRTKYPDQFKLRLRWKFQVTENIDVNIENSGYQAYEALSLEEVERAISDKLDQVKQWLASSYLNREVMEVYGIQSFNCNNPERINLKRLTISAPKEAVVKCLTHIETEIKQPLMDLFKVYYRLKENEGLAFNEHLLEHLGFSVCKQCRAKALWASLTERGLVRAA
jgi:predicted metal-binding protein